MKHYALLTISLLALSGCSGLGETLGFGRNAPDEFAVVDRPPLSLPPDFSLRPPQPGAPRPQEIDMTDRAESIVTGKGAKAPKSSGKQAQSVGEKALLQSAGTDKAQPEIRTLVDKEASQKIVGSKHLVDQLLWWRDPAQQSTTVDAVAERERIREAKEKGEPINEGATPVIERQKSGFLGL